MLCGNNVSLCRTQNLLLYFSKQMVELAISTKTYFFIPRTFVMYPLIAKCDWVGASSSSTLFLPKNWREDRGDLSKCKTISITYATKWFLLIMLEIADLPVVLKFHHFLFNFAFFLFQEPIEHVRSVNVSQWVVSAKVWKNRVATIWSTPNHKINQN